MRVRRLELRLIAAVLAGLWVATCVLLLGWYRPGGPLDLAIGLAAAVPAAIAVVAVARPPSPGSPRGWPGVAWLGIVTALVLAPLAAGVAGVAAAQRPQAVVPSPEVAYAWLVALSGSSLFVALGLPGPAPGPPAARRRRLAIAGGLAIVLAAVSAGLMGGAALVNAAAIGDQPAAASRFGPTDAAGVPTGCRGVPGVGATARLRALIAGESDRGPLGEAAIEGVRAGDDITWTADVATSAAAGPAGVAVIGSDGWQREPGDGWAAVPAAALEAEHLDATVVAAALEPERLVAAEDRGVVRVEEAPARHCRVAIDGTIFRAAFPQVRWFAGDRSLHRWRGEIDYYVFGDDQLGLVEAWVNGEAEPVTPDAIQATIRVRLEATDRGEPVSLEPPTGG